MLIEGLNNKMRIHNVLRLPETNRDNLFLVLPISKYSLLFLFLNLGSPSSSDLVIGTSTVSSSGLP